MTDRDRLIDLLKKADDIASKKLITDYDDAIADNADHLLANGVIVPPCKVGDKIYFVVEYDGKYFLDEGEVSSIYKDEGGIWVSARYDSGLHYHHNESDFGKTVFLTEEEAEKALAERSGEK